jgi:hypothetical protein
MPTGIKIVGVPKEPLSIAYLNNNKKDQILAKSGPTVRKRGGL